MTQYLEKSALVAEIDRLQKPTMDENNNFTSDYNQGFYDGLSQLELFIESLPKEKKPIREYVSPEDSTLGKLLKEMKDFSPQEDLGLSNEEYNDVVNELIFGKEKSVSEALEEAACEYDNSHIDDNNIAFKAGAQWQKEQMIYKACEWLKENKDHPFIKCEDPCLSGYLTDEFIGEFKKAMEE